MLLIGVSTMGSIKAKSLCITSKESACKKRHSLSDDPFTRARRATSRLSEFAIPGIKLSSRRSSCCNSCNECVYKSLGRAFFALQRYAATPRACARVHKVPITRNLAKYTDSEILRSYFLYLISVTIYRYFCILH